MTKKKENTNSLDVLIYANHNELFFQSLNLIREGVIRIKKTDGSLIMQQRLSNVNSAHLTLPMDIRKVEVTFISKKFIYKKTIRI